MPSKHTHSRICPVSMHLAYVYVMLGAVHLSEGATFRGGGYLPSLEKEP